MEGTLESREGSGIRDANEARYLLIDCNNFFASCERVFRPDLVTRPVVVLSSNDGCVVARSREAKDLNIPMGEPAFKLKTLFERHHVAVFSSNFQLYGELSRRVIATIESLVENVEQYSIDECFVPLAKAHTPNVMELAHAIRSRVLQWVGIPVSIGIAQTRTLAKLACYIAKKNKGIFFLNGSEAQHDVLFSSIPVEEVWGIGRRFAVKLHRAGIATVRDLKHAPSDWVRANLSFTGFQTLLELRGVACIENIVNVPTERKTLVASRTFGEKIRDFTTLSSALSSFVSSAAVRLRKGDLAAGGLEVFIRTSRFSDAYSEGSWQTTLRPTCDTAVLIRAALTGLRTIFTPGVPYAKGGVLLFDLRPGNVLQGNLLDLEEADRDAKRARLMRSLDAINRRYGRGNIRFAVEGSPDAPWHPKRERTSPAYLSSWQHLPVAYCREERRNTIGEFKKGI